jgi:hypothetical protein
MVSNKSVNLYLVLNAIQWFKMNNKRERDRERERERERERGRER